MLLEGVLLSEVFNVMSTESGIGMLVSLQIFALQEQSIVSLLKASLKFSHLSAQVKVAGSLEFVVLSKFVKIANLLVGVSAELTGVRLKACVQVLGAEDLLLDILKEELLVSELVAASINDLLGVIDSQVHS